MTIFKTILISVIFLVGASSGLAWEAVDILDSEASISMTFRGYGSLIPATCSWYLDESIDSGFSSTNADGEGLWCSNIQWLIRCDENGMEIHSNWPDIKSHWAFYTWIQSETSCTVVVNDETRFLASRSVEANLTTDEHIITVTYPDGTITNMLWEGSSSRQAELLLEPGTYTVSLRVNAMQESTFYEAIEGYDGQLLLSWSDPGSVSLKVRSWDAVKSYYR